MHPPNVINDVWRFFPPTLLGRTMAHFSAP
nr:MAG TPA: hypothetical protein [Caudoviricetes sp.]